MKIGCPANCASCNDGTHCTLCDVGYGLLNNLCQICPNKMYLSGGNCESIFKFNVFLE